MNVLDLILPPAIYAGRRPFCFTGVVYFFFFAAESPRSLDWLSSNFATEIWVTPSPRNLAAQKRQNLRRSLIVNVSGTQVTVNRKTALQTTDTPAQANLSQYTLVHKWQK